MLQKYGNAERRAMVDLYNSGYSIKEVAEQMGCSYPTAWRILHEEGVRVRNNAGIKEKNFSEEELNELVAKYQAGYTLEELASLFSCSFSTIALRLKERGIERRSQGRCGVCGLRKSFYLALYNDIGSYAEVGRVLGLSRQRVHQIINK